MPEADAEEFEAATSRYRRELLAHCYRMTGSVQEAEDIVQDTYVRAWRAFGRFEGRSSIRTWLYRIATNACLTALQRRSRRPLPSGLGPPSPDPLAPPWLEPPEVRWLEPVPDHLVIDEAGDPANIVTARESVRLALMTALQVLPPRQRAALILCEVLSLTPAGAAEVLDVSVAALKSLLQRARTRLAKVPLSDEDLAEPSDKGARRVLDRYMAAPRAIGHGRS
ncbi:MAG: RNA polymerase subunit sigma-70 [Streptosporangiaceae bacterium]|jgi:RNA polymerase sigma-70 factor (ECF subfamily)